MFELSIIILLIIGNGFLAMSEFAIFAARRTRLQERAEGGNRGARVALELAKEPNRLLSTIQIGITLVGIFAGAFGGATIAEKLAARLSHIPYLSPYSKAIGVGTVVLVITYFSLVIGELVPKRIGLHYAEQISSAVAIPMRMLSTLAAPAVHLLSFSTEMVLRVLGLRNLPSTQTPVSEEEFKIMLDEGTQTGVFEELEQDIVERVFHLSDRKVSGLMTPRSEIVWLNVNDPPEELQQKVIDSTHSWFPVARDSLDEVLGLIKARDLLAWRTMDQPIEMEGLLSPPLFVPGNVNGLRALEMIRESHSHIALVLDEYGSVQGLVTINDILEAIVGDIPALDEPPEPEAVQREDGSWLLDGMLSVGEFKEMFQIEGLPGEEEGYYETLGGLVMMSLERIPSAGDHFEVAGVRVEVVDMDGYRVDKLLVAPARREDRDEGDMPEDIPTPDTAQED